MALRATLNAERRSTKGKGAARKLRAQGRIPGVVYGPGTDPISVSFETREIENLFQNISVDNTIVDLVIDDQDDGFQTLVREIQTHPFRPHILHVDFLRIQSGVAVELDIPVHLVGTAPGVRDEGGVIEQVIHEMPVKCLPSLIPEAIEVDVSGLHLQDSLHVSDIEFSEGVEVLLEPDRTICSVTVPRLVLEEPEVEEELEEEVEVLRVGDEEEADVEAAAEEEEESEGD